MLYSVLAQVENGAYEFGRNMATVVLVCLFLAGALKGIKAAREGTYQKLIPLGLILTMGGLTLMAAMARLKDLLPAKGFAFAAMGVILVVLAGGALALVGLINCLLADEKPKGRKMAIATLAVSGIIGVFFGLGVVNGLRQGGQQLDRQSTNTAKTQVQNEYVFSEHGFRFAAPSDTWSVLADPSVLNPAAAISLVQEKPERYFIIIAEDIGQAIPLPMLATAVKHNLQQSASNVTFPDEAEVTIDAQTWHRLQANATINELDLHYIYFLRQDGTRFYQLMTWGYQNDSEGLAQAARDLAERWSLIGEPPAAPAQ